MSNSILVRPLVNEKSMALIKNGLFTFEVSKEATKSQIEKIVRVKFNVDVISVKTLTSKPKIKAQRTRKGYFKKAGIKKAIVKLKKGQKIVLFEHAEKEEVEVRTAEGETVTTVKERKSLLKGTKIKIEKEAMSKGQIEEKTDGNRPTKTSQKENKKGGK